MKEFIRLVFVAALTAGGMALLVMPWPSKEPAPKDYSQDVKALWDKVGAVEQIKADVQTVRADVQDVQQKTALQVSEGMGTAKTATQEAVDGAVAAAEQRAADERQKLHNAIQGLQGQLNKAAEEAAAAKAKADSLDVLHDRVRGLEKIQAAPKNSPAPPKAAAPPARKPVTAVSDRVLYLTGENCHHCRNVESYDLPALAARGISSGPGREFRIQKVDVNSREGQQYVQDLGLHQEPEFGLPFFVRLIGERPARKLTGRHPVETLYEFVTQAMAAPGPEVRPVSPAPKSARPIKGSGPKDA